MSQFGFCIWVNQPSQTQNKRHKHVRVLRGILPVFTVCSWSRDANSLEFLWALLEHCNNWAEHERGTIKTAWRRFVALIHDWENTGHMLVIEGKRRQHFVIREIGEESNEVTYEPTPLCPGNEVSVGGCGQIPGRPLHHLTLSVPCHFAWHPYGAGLSHCFIRLSQRKRWFMAPADPHSQQTSAVLLCTHVMDYPVCLVCGIFEM